MEIQDLYEKITDNKIYLDLKEHTEEINPLVNKNLFDDISLKYLLNNRTLENQNVANVTNIINNEPPTKNKKNIKNTKHHKFINNSLLSELSSLVLIDENEIKDKIKEYVNSSSSNDYLKTLSRSYKKLRIDINNILVKNLDNYIFNELFYIICKVFNINLIVINDMKKIYDNYEIDKTFEYYVFSEITNDKNKNYLFKENIVNDNVSNYLNNYNKRLELSKLKQLKVDELKELSKKYKINTNQKKQELINDLSKFT